MAEAEGGAGGGRRARAAELRARPEQPGEARRPDHHRHRQRLAEDLDRQVARRRAAQRARQELDVVEGGFVPPKRPLVLRAAVGEVEDRSRKSALRQPAHVGDVERCASSGLPQSMLEGSAVEAVEVDGCLAEKLSLLLCARALRHPIDDARPIRDRRWRAPSRASRRHTSSGRTRSTRWRARCRASAARASSRRDRPRWRRRRSCRRRSRAWRAPSCARATDRGCPP